MDRFLLRDQRFIQNIRKKIKVLKSKLNFYLVFILEYRKTSMQ